MLPAPHSMLTAEGFKPLFKPLFIPFNLFLSLSTFTDRSTIVPSRTQVGGSVRS